MDVFCQKHSHCEESILVIAEILSNGDSMKLIQISNEFKLLGFEKVKDLAKTTLGKASTITLGDGDPLAKLYDAIEIYDQRCADRFKLAKLKYQEKNFVKSQKICEELFLYQPYDLNIIILLAASYYNQKEYDKSIECLETATDINPQCAEVYLNLGTNYLRKYKLKEAYNCYLKSIHLKTNFESLINLAQVLELMSDKNKAAEVYHYMIIRYPHLSYIVRNLYGKLLLSLNNIKEAKYQYKHAINLAPEFPDTWNNLGDLYIITKKTKKAVTNYEKTLELNPDSSVTWINLGISYYKLSEFQKAIEAFQNVLKLSPGNMSALKKLCTIYFYQDNIPMSIETLKKCLEIEPNDLWSNLNLGCLYFQNLKNNEEAKKYFQKCIDISPQTDIYYKYLCSVYHNLGEVKNASENFMLLGDLYLDQRSLENARNAYMNSLFLNPENADGHWKLGLTLYQMNHYDLALKRYRKTIELKPTFPNVYCDCALIYEVKNLHHQAIEYYKMALKLQPDDLITLHNITHLKQKLGHLNDVVELYKIMLEHDDSDSFKINVDLANILYKEMGNFEEALFHYNEALSFDDTFLEVYIDMGSVLIELGKCKEALDCFHKAIQLDPQCIIAYTNIGSIHKDNGNFVDAIHAYESVIEIKPDFPEAYCNLVQCLQHICNWSNYDYRISKLKDIVYQQLNYDQVPSLLPHHSLLYSFSPEILKKIASKHAENSIKKALKARAKKLLQDYVFPMSLSYNGCIRIGYVSSDFGNHPTSQLMQSILKLHNRNKIEVFCYSLLPNDNTSSWFKISTISDHFRDISNLNAIDAANQINKDGIHILLNMNGHTRGARNEIFALRPAPIQVLWLGYPGTSGATFIDYIITDKICSPPEFIDYYSEKLIYMNRTVFIGDHKQMFSDLTQRFPKKEDKNVKSTISMNNENTCTNDNSCSELLLTNIITSMYSVKLFPDTSVKCYTRQMYSVPEDAIVFCNFSQLYKIDPLTFNMWLTILKHVPNSVLWLLRLPEAGEHNLLAYAAEQNIDSSRIIFGNIEQKYDHMRRIQLADIFLDTPLCNGHTTCLDALWAGTPIITLPGETFASRVAASLLTTLGYTDTIAQNVEDYIKKAVYLGSNITELDIVRTNIWKLKMESKLFDCKSYTEELEIVYFKIWNNFVSNSHPNI